MSRSIIGPRGVASHTPCGRVCGIDDINTESPIDKLSLISTNLIFITSTIFSNKLLSHDKEEKEVPNGIAKFSETTSRASLSLLSIV